jgi:hypothetical protein
MMRQRIVHRRRNERLRMYPGRSHCCPRRCRRTVLRPFRGRLALRRCIGWPHWQSLQCRNLLAARVPVFREPFEGVRSANISFPFFVPCFSPSRFRDSIRSLAPPAPHPIYDLSLPLVYRMGVTTVNGKLQSGETLRSAVAMRIRDTPYPQCRSRISFANALSEITRTTRGCRRYNCAPTRSD